MTEGMVRVKDLEALGTALGLLTANDPLSYEIKEAFLREVKSVLVGEIAKNEWKDLVAYWQDGTVCEVKFEGFRINKVGKIEMLDDKGWGSSYLGGYFASSENSWFTQDIRFKEHRWEFRIWTDRKDPEGWPLV